MLTKPSLYPLWIYLLLLYLTPSIFAKQQKSDGEIGHLLDKADALMGEGQDSAAYPLIIKADSLLELKSDEASALLKDKLLGDYYFGLRDYKQARLAYENVLKNNRLNLETTLGVKTARAINDLGIVYYRLGELNLAKQAHYRSIELYKHYGDKEGLTFNYGNLAIISREQRNLDSAIYYSQKTREVAIEIKDTLSIGISHIRLGRIYGTNREEIKGINELRKAIEVLEGPDYERFSNSAKSSLSVFYYQIGDYSSAKKILFELADYYEKKNVPLYKRRYFSELADLYVHTKQLDSADFYLDKEFQVLQENKSVKRLANYYEIKGKVLRARGNYTEALDSHKKALELYAGKYIATSGGTMLSIANVYNLLNEPQKTLEWVNKALTIFGDKINEGSLSLSYELRYKAYKSLNQPAKALEFMELFHKQKSKFHSNENKMEIARIEYQNQLEREKALEQALQEKKDLAYQQQLDRQQWVVFSTIGASLLLGLILVILYRSYQAKQKANIQLEESAEELKTMNTNLIEVREKERSLTEELQTAYEQLQELDNSKTRFFTNISHELRTPLTLIIGMLERLRGKVNSEDVKDILVATQHSKLLHQLINQLLDITKLDANKMELNIRQEPIIRLLKSYLFSFESLADQKKIKLDFKSNQTHYDGYLDRQALEKIIYNLLSNAYKFTPENGEIRMSVDIHDGFGTITIEDTGIGIPQAQLPYIFDRFYQADKSLSKQEGTGIGLTLVKELIELHKGKIDVNSKEGVGTSFIVQLPISPAAYQPDELAKSPQAEGYQQVIEPLGTPSYASKKQEAAEIPKDGNKPLVLLVEDHADLQELIKGELMDDYHIIQAFDGEEGASMALEQVPDLIISDVMMPQKDGFELCAELKQDQRTSHIPIILLTARAEQADKLQGLETGADDYLAKPFDQQELQIRVRNLIQSRETLKKRFAEKTELVMIQPSEVAHNATDQAFMENLMDVLEQNYANEHFNPDQIADLTKLNKRQLNKKLNAMLDTSASKLLQNFRLQKAKELLNDQALRVGEISFMVGFSSHSYFNRTFKSKFGITPKEYQLNLKSI